MQSSISTRYAKSIWYVKSHALSSTHLIFIWKIIVLQLIYRIKCIHTQGEYKLYSKKEKIVCIQLVNKRKKGKINEPDSLVWICYSTTWLTTYSSNDSIVNLDIQQAIKEDIYCYCQRHPNFNLSPLILSRCMVFSLHYDETSYFMF